MPAVPPSRLPHRLRARPVAALLTAMSLLAVAGCANSTADRSRGIYGPGEQTGQPIAPPLVVDRVQGGLSLADLSPKVVQPFGVGSGWFQVGTDESIATPGGVACGGTVPADQARLERRAVVLASQTDGYQLDTEVVRYRPGSAVLAFEQIVEEYQELRCRTYRTDYLKPRSTTETKSVNVEKFPRGTAPAGEGSLAVMERPFSPGDGNQRFVTYVHVGDTLAVLRVSGPDPDKVEQLGRQVTSNLVNGLERVGGA